MTQDCNDTIAPRYSRTVFLKEWGEQGQKSLAKTHFLIIGAGGLGCPAALCLAQNGAGHITIVDADVVDTNNLPRQFLHTPERVGMNKAQSVVLFLSSLTPDVPIRAVDSWADDALLLDLIPQHDIILDCSDNSRTRHAVNRAACACGKPLITASAVRFSGQIAVFDFREPKGGCYACLFPPDEEPDVKAATAGVYPPVTGVIGMMAAGEAMKMAADIPSLRNELLIYDGLRMTTQTLRFEHDPNCPVCND